MLTCEEITHLVTEYIEGRMRWMDRVRFRMHVAMCKHCREYVAQMKLAARTLARMPESPVPEESMRHMVVAFRNWNG